MMTRKVISVILGALMIIAGVYCFFTPVETSAVIPFVLGIVMIGDGIGRIATWFDIRDIVRQSAWVLVSAVVSLMNFDFIMKIAFFAAVPDEVGVLLTTLISRVSDVLLPGSISGISCGRVHGCW